MIAIRLPKGEWKYEPNLPLGPAGGFGAVFFGEDKDKQPIAVKRLHLKASEASHRELAIADDLIQRSFRYVMPILDAGQDAESDNYFVIMPVAEKSLQDEINRQGQFAEKEAANILLEVARGLKEVEDIVHRDLKPGNILYHNAVWKVADFGIARFIEESTSLQTLKDFLSPQYASPEQWRMERATHATDVYALGCVAYSLLTGKPPFLGTSYEDYREAHLFQQPAPIAENLPRLRSLIAMMLRKNPSARPSLERIIQILETIISEPMESNMEEGLQALANAGALAAEEENRSDAIQSKKNSRSFERTQLADESFQILQIVVQHFSSVIANLAPNSSVENSKRSMWRIQLGDATLEIAPLYSGKPIEENFFSESKWDVVSGAYLVVTQNRPSVYKWGANLWYTNLGLHREYRWWEVPYFNTGSTRIKMFINYTPFALGDTEKDFHEADLAASNTMHVINMATEPSAIDDENIDEFCNRWAELLAKAYHGRLMRPRTLPFSK